MKQTLAVNVPDIGDFKDVTIIEVLVNIGEAVTVEQSLITLETDKATVDIPSPAAGVVKELKIKIGDKVNQGDLILMLETEIGSRRTYLFACSIHSSRFHLPFLRGKANFLT